MHISRALFGRRAASAGACALITLVFAATTAQAADVFFVDFAALGDGVTDTVAQRVNQNLKEQLRQARVDFIDEVAQAQEGESGASAVITQANADYQTGVGLYVVQDYAGAITAFESALAGYARAVGDIENFRSVADALFNLAECQYKSGNEEMARVTLMRAFAVKPDTDSRDASGQAYNQFFATVKDAIARNGQGSIVVSSSPEGLTVTIDGVELGATPLTVPDVPVGDHYVAVTGEAGSAGQVVSVQRNRDAEVRLGVSSQNEVADAGGDPRYLRSLRSAVSAGTISDSLLPYLGELATRQAVDYVVVGAIVSGDDEYKAHSFIYRASDGLFAVGPVQGFDSALSNLRVNSYQMAANVGRAAGRSFPQSDLVTGAPLIAPEAPEVEVAAAPEAAAVEERPVMEIPDMEVSAAPTRSAPEPPAPVVEVAVAAPTAPVNTAPQAPAQPAQPAQPTYQQPAQPAQPSYGQPAQPAQPSYGQPAQPAQPTYGQPTYGQPTQPAQPSYGQPTYGQPAQPAQPSYGQPQYGQPTYGQPAQPAQPSYGQPTYGQPAQPAQPTYGQPTYGQPQYGQPTYGQPAQPAQPSYGQPTYGQPAQPAQPSYGQPTYGQPVQPAQPTYGQPTYGQPVQSPQPTYGQPQYEQQPVTQPQYAEQPGFAFEPELPAETREKKNLTWLYVTLGVIAAGGAATAGILAAGGNEGGMDATISF